MPPDKKRAFSGRRHGRCNDRQAEAGSREPCHLYMLEGLMDLVITLVTGGLIGWLASLLMRTDGQMGVLANILVGIVGSILGSWLAGVLGIAVAGSPGRWLVGLLGAMLLLALLRALGGMRSTARV
jgi:uncharacterized membrane protein YeaQ/YmgE (transglycosylase-associated protein family)